MLSLFRDISPNICKNSFLNSTKFFPRKTSFSKNILNIPGKEDLETYSEPSRTSSFLQKYLKAFAVISFRKKIVLDVRLGSEYDSRMFRYS